MKLTLSIQDIDECSNTTICPYSSYCVNFDGSYNCSICPEGYHGNGTICEGTINKYYFLNFLHLF